jgi:hypothetical protein
LSRKLHFGGATYPPRTSSLPPPTYCHAPTTDRVYINMLDQND